MPKLPVLTGPELVKLATERGFIFERRRGSHVVLSKGSAILIIPVHANRPIKTGLRKQILKELGIEGDELNRKR